MARSALVAAVATLLVLGAAAGDSKNSGSSNKNSGSSDKASAAANKAASAKLKPGPVCTATKDAFKSYNSCATFREEIWCGFLQADDGCDLQNGVEVIDTATAIATGLDESLRAEIYQQVFGNIVQIGVPFSSDGTTCTIDEPAVVPLGTAATCVVDGPNTLVLVGCPANTVPTGVGCQQGAFVFPGSTPGAQLVSAQCVYPTTTVTGGAMTVTCMPSDVVVPAGAKAAAGAKLPAAKPIGKVAAQQKAILAALKIKAFELPAKKP